MLKPQPWRSEPKATVPSRGDLDVTHQLVVEKDDNVHVLDGVTEAGVHVLTVHLQLEDERSTLFTNKEASHVPAKKKPSTVSHIHSTTLTFDNNSNQSDQIDQSKPTTQTNHTKPTTRNQHKAYLQSLTQHSLGLDGAASMQSTTTKAPSVIRRAAVTSTRSQRGQGVDQVDQGCSPYRPRGPSRRTERHRWT